MRAVSIKQSQAKLRAKTHRAWANKTFVLSRHGNVQNAKMDAIEEFFFIQADGEILISA